jgi:hypothetical protein
MAPKPRKWEGSAAKSKPDKLLDETEKEPGPQPTRKEKLKAFWQVASCLVHLWGHFQLLNADAFRPRHIMTAASLSESAHALQGIMTGCIIHT